MLHRRKIKAVWRAIIAPASTDCFCGWPFGTAQGRRFVFLAVAALLTIYGIEPVSWLLSLRASSGNVAAISLYAGDCTAPASEDHASGWWNQEKAAGAPDLGPESDIREFSDANSAFYQGSRSALTCSGFKALTEEAVKIETIDDEAEEDPLLQEEIEAMLETDSEAASSSIEIDMDIASGTSDEGYVDESVEDSEAQEAEGEAVIDEAVLPEGDAVVETIDEAAEAPVSIEELESEEALIEVSGEEAAPEDMAPDADGILAVPEAGAQEFLPAGTEDYTKLGEFKSAKLRLSLAWQEIDRGTGTAPAVASKLAVWYAYDETTASGSDEMLWQMIDTLEGDELSNALNNGYLELDAPFIASWQDAAAVKIKVEGQAEGEASYIAYLDSVWVEAEYETEDPLELLKKRQRWENALEMLSANALVWSRQDGKLEFRYNKNEERIWDTLKELVGLADYWDQVDIRAQLFDSRGEALGNDSPFGGGEGGGYVMLLGDDGEFTISLPGVRALKPGRYTVRFHIEDSSGDEVEVFDIDKSFSWGTLAINFNRSEYLAGEEGYIQMAVLDELGHTVCDASVELRVTNAELLIDEVLSTENGRIARSAACGPETVTDEPDYSARFVFPETGEYEVSLAAKTESGWSSAAETVTVAGSREISVERSAATRIWPKAEYGMKVLVGADEDYRGDIVEVVPAKFKITNYELRITNNDEHDPYGGQYEYKETVDGDTKSLIWHDVDLKAGDELEIVYQFDAPDISPELFLLGPLELVENSKFEIRNSKFREPRSWQLASDAVNKRARTVMFYAGQYAGGPTTGASTNVDQSFAAFNFQLAETGVDIRNAFVVFESQFEAYGDNASNYSGYKIAFDSCVKNCSANAWSGSGRSEKDDTTILAYNETESNFARLVTDVTNEAQLADYTGNGVVLEAQVGYHIKHLASLNSIANAKAILVLTYTYDDDSPNITNTVVYPLDSTNGTDNGSRQLSHVGNCILNNNCPVFDYKMEIPEFPGFATSSYRLSQWFKTFTFTDGNVSNDIGRTVNIQGVNATSSYFHHDNANAGSQGNGEDAYFADVGGFNENQAQQLEMYASSSASQTYYLEGGEVFETYIASSSQATKTRTVAFPIGVIKNTSSLSAQMLSADVYFPENGAATGTVKIKKAWVRLLSNNYASAGYSLTASTKVGSRATSTPLAYNYNGAGSVVKLSFPVFHIIPSADYAALEEANAAVSVPVRVAVLNNNTVDGGTAAELMVTYTYESEDHGYLAPLQLFGGQSDATPSTTTKATTSASVFPETRGITLRGASLLAHFTQSHSLGNVPAGIRPRFDANIAVSNPACSASFVAEPDDFNSFIEMYRLVTSAMSTTDNQVYQACLTGYDAASQQTVVKAGAVLSYVYQWDNARPTGAFNSAVFRTDGSGTADLSLEIDDPDDQDCRAKLEYVAGAGCDFASPLDPALSTADAGTSADYGDPDIDNGHAYQVGTTSAYIYTASGTNSVLADWQVRQDLPEAEGTYCLRLTANDKRLDQAQPATTTVYIDTKAPTAPGALSLSKRTGTSTTLAFGATSTETNFLEYKIFYKQHDGSDPKESDTVWASTSDINLFNKFLNNKSTTTITGLTASTTYSFAIWAYDAYGNKASSSRVDITTNDPPTIAFNSAAQKTDGTGRADISIEANDPNGQDTLRVKVEYVAGAACDFAVPEDPTLDESAVSADFGTPNVANGREFQVGGPNAWIWTNPGSNTVNFDWLTQADLPAGNGTYCLRLTVADHLDEQAVKATTTLVVDNVKPTVPGALSPAGATIASVRLAFAPDQPAADTNEPSANAYRIYYKPGTSGVTTANTEHDASSLDKYDYNGATSTLVAGLSQNIWYVFNIWAYDAYGNRSTSTEVAVKTNATIANQSFAFVNPQTSGPATNIAVADSVTDWTFRAVVSEQNGWYALASTTLRLADLTDASAPYSDLAFKWLQSDQTFYEIGADQRGAVFFGQRHLDLFGRFLTIDFNLRFNKNFTATSTPYAVEVLSINDGGVDDDDIYDDIYQVRFPYLVQTHYRWRNNDGGE